MNCKYHTNLKGTNTCSSCSDWICEDCVLEIEGRIYCKDCLKSKLKSEKTYEAHKTYSTSYSDRRVYKSGFLTFILSAIPGASQMYLGYTKRGLFILSFWLLGVYIEAFSILIPVTYILGLVDALKLKSNLERGIYQEDSICDIKKFVSENKFFVTVLSVLIIIPMIFNFFEDILDDFFDMCEAIFNNFGIYGYDIENIFKLVVGVVIILLVIFIFKSKKNDKNNKIDNI